MTFDGFILPHLETNFRKSSIEFYIKKQKNLDVERDGGKIETE